MKYSSGFTLIELIVVISILGILAIVLITTINPLGQLAKTRDVGRKNDVAQLKRALESYRTLNGGSYPTTGWVNSTSGTTWIPNMVSSGESRALPIDPKNVQTGGLPWSSPTNYAYYYLSNSWYDGVGGPSCGANPTNFYLLTVHLENAADPLS